MLYSRLTNMIVARLNRKVKLFTLPPPVLLYGSEDDKPDEVTVSDDDMRLILMSVGGLDAHTADAVIEAIESRL